MIQRLGDGAVRFPRPEGKDGSALLERVRSWAGVADACLTETWIGVLFEEGVQITVTEALVASLVDAPSETEATREIEIAVRYDGEDLGDVARACGMSTRHVCALHAGAEYRALFLGFMPGFAYLGGLPSELVVPRLGAPRVRVPKNAVAIAGPYAGIYPFASPGGWRLLGTALDVELFGERGALLRPGDRVRFRDTA